MAPATKICIVMQMVDLELLISTTMNFISDTQGPCFKRYFKCLNNDITRLPKIFPSGSESSPDEYDKEVAEEILCCE